MIRTFEEAVKYLEGFIPAPDKKHPGSLGLRRMEAFMDLLSNPQNTYPTIHVGGTSGKGSTATIIASILATKYKVGLHTSPHLVKINERIKVIDKSFWGLRAKRGGLQNRFWTCLRRQASQNDEISDKDFVRLLNEVQPGIKIAEKSQYGPPSYFEIVTAMAFLYFKKVKVDIAVIEVGMGGRYDGTNVIKPLAAVLTNVGLDHTEVLGNTVEKIAIDKAGIIKPGIAVVTGAKQPAVIKIIEREAIRVKRKGSANLSLLRRDFKYKIKSIDAEGCVFDYFGDHIYKNLKLSLLGEHQVENAVLAIRAIELLHRHSGERLRHQNHIQCKRFWTCLRRQASQNDLEKSIRQGLEYAFIPGRLEIIKLKPLVILDGSHNPDKMKALVKAIRTIFHNKKIISVVAIKEDKQSKEMLRQVLKISKRVVFTKFQLTADMGVISSYAPEVLFIIAQDILQERYSLRYTGVVEMVVEEDIRKAMERTINSAKDDDIILVTGSLYLVGEIRKDLGVRIKTYEKNIANANNR